LASCSVGEKDAAPTSSAGSSATASSPDRQTSSSSPLPPVVPVTPRAPGTADSASPSSSPPAPTPAAGLVVASARWADSAYGPTLKVAPTEAGRTASGPADARVAWEEVLTLAPDADTPGMWEQFDCHWTWARLLEPDKPTWNVGPWRPVGDEGQMVAEACNPGGPEVGRRARQPGGRSRPASAARVATPARLRAPSLVMIRLTRSLTVCTLRWTRSEISWLE